MRNSPLLPEEELLLAAADMPVLSPGFRTRVLDAAIETQYRQSYARRALWAAGLLIAVLGLMAWRGPLSNVHDEVADAGASAKGVIRGLEGQPRVRCPGLSQRYGKGELLLSASGDDWRLVEAEEQSRRVSLRHVRM